MAFFFIFQVQIIPITHPKN